MNAASLSGALEARILASSGITDVNQQFGPSLNIIGANGLGVISAGNTITIEAAALSGLAASHNTLDAAYDQGGPGEGRRIYVNSGPVSLSGLQNNKTLEIIGDVDFLLNSNICSSGDLNFETNEIDGSGIKINGLYIITNIAGASGAVKSSGQFIDIQSPDDTILINSTGNIINLTAVGDGSGVGQINGLVASDFEFIGVSGIEITAIGPNRIEINGGALSGVAPDSSGIGLINGQDGPNIIFRGATGIDIAAATDVISVDAASLSGALETRILASSGITDINQQFGPSIDIIGAEGIGVSTVGNVITIEGASLSGLASNKNTLDEAYDEGGAGAGRGIIVDNGAVTLSGTQGNTSLDITGHINFNSDSDISVSNGELNFETDERQGSGVKINGLYGITNIAGASGIVTSSGQFVDIKSNDNTISVTPSGNTVLLSTSLRCLRRAVSPAAKNVTITHNLNTTHILVQAIDSNNFLVIPDTVRILANSVTVTFVENFGGSIHVIACPEFTEV